MDMVIVKHVDDIINFSNFLPVGPVWCIEMIVLTVKDGLTMTRWYFNVFLCLLTKQHTAFTISGFPVSRGIVETPVMWGGKIKQLLIAYFLGNTFVKNYQNPFMHVIIIGCNIGVVFLRHSIVLRKLNHRVWKRLTQQVVSAQSHSVFVLIWSHIFHSMLLVIFLLWLWSDIVITDTLSEQNGSKVCTWWAFNSQL